METWIIIIVSISIAALARPFINLVFPKNTRNLKLPPGPTIFPVIGTILYLLKPYADVKPVPRSILAKFGPIVTLRIGSIPTVFIADGKLVQKTLVQNGIVFGHRPSPPETYKVITSNRHTISSSSYGPRWRLLRRNLTAEILNPTRVKSYKHARQRVLQILLNSLKKDSQNGEQTVRPIDHFQYAMFCLLVLMCFGDNLSESQLRKIEKVNRDSIIGSGHLLILNFIPKLTKIFLRKKWEQFLQLHKDQEDVFIPLIQERKKAKESRSANKGENDCVIAYVDTLLDLTLPEENRKLTDKEIVSLVSEFLIAGTDTTFTALEWIMAHLVKSPEIQEKLYGEIKGVVKDGEEEVKEEDVETMPYLRAVVLEGLRRHPPGYVLLPHSVSEDVELDGYLIPKEGMVNVMMSEVGWDPTVWEDPMSFKPERFLNGEEIDLTGSKEIKMMPFGAGRRFCPGYKLALLHLEYFVANLVWSFEWKAVDDVDMTEIQEFTIVMKNPLKARLHPRTSR